MCRRPYRFGDSTTSIRSTLIAVNTILLSLKYNNAVCRHIDVDDAQSETRGIMVRLGVDTPLIRFAPIFHDGIFLRPHEFS